MDHQKGQGDESFKSDASSAQPRGGKGRRVTKGTEHSVQSHNILNKNTFSSDSVHSLECFYTNADNYLKYNKT